MNWLREIKIVLTNKEQPNRNPITFVSTGSDKTYNISFNVKKSFVSSNENSMEVVIYNLNPDKIQSLIAKQMGYNLELYVGYENQELSLLGKGSIKRIWYEREGIDTKITIQSFLFNYSLSSNRYATVFDYAFVTGYVENGTTLGTNVYGRKLKDVLLQFFYFLKDKKIYPELLIDQKNIKTEKKFPDWYTLMYGLEGKAKDIVYSGKTFVQMLDELSREWGFSWGIVDDIIYVLDDEEEITESSTKLKFFTLDETNIFSSSIVFQGEYGQIQVGMRCDCVLDTNVSPGKTVDFKSSLYKEQNGRYFVQSAEYSGGTKSSEWKMSLETYKTRYKKTGYKQ